MKNRVLPAALLCAGLAFGHAVVPGTPAAAEELTVLPARIMLAGDSITQGFDGDYTWRYRLYKELKRQKLGFDFVGPEDCPTGRAGGASCTYLVPGSTWDTDHTAKGGTRLYEQVGLYEPQTLAYDYLRNTNYRAVVVAIYGTTDMLDVSRGVKRNGIAVAVDDVIDSWRDFINQIRSIRADATIIVGEVTTRRVPKRQEYNDKLGALVAELTTPYSPIVVADMDYPSWDPAKNTYDTVHPNPAGEAVIAQRIGWALKSAGVTKQSPAISSTGLSWNPPWAPSIRVSQSRRLVVNWSASYRKYAPKLVRVQLRNLQTRKVGTSAWSGSTQYISAPARPGKYRVTIQGRRDTMISPWSKSFTITVKRR